MDTQATWKAFESTGEIQAYLRYKQQCSQSPDSAGKEHYGTCDTRPCAARDETGGS